MVNLNSTLNNFTMQYSTSSWGLERHNAGGLWDLQDGTCHHSLWAHHRTRNPKARPYGLLEWINNVTFHWRSEGFIIDDPLTAYKKVLSSAGALRLDAGYAGPLRDELDSLLIQSVEDQVSILVAKDTPRTNDPGDPPSNGEAQLADPPYNISNGGFGTLNSAAAPADSDGDGMPDAWETTLGSNVSVQDHNTPVPAGAYVPNIGYTLLEESLHFNNVDAGTGGPALMEIRFALGAASQRIGKLVVNGAVSSLTHLPTGSWSNWVTMSGEIVLGPGSTNLIRIAPARPRCGISLVWAARRDTAWGRGRWPA
ncbi:MAG: hypothetical protein MUC91_07715 [Verrucomicrobia bacterium]|nr:hypothetical protein [Verrucomicrobiota bacterium]